MKKLLILLCVMITILFTTAAFWSGESKASGEDLYVPAAGKYTSVEEMRDKRIGVLTGSCFDTVATEQFPDAQLLYFNSHADMLTALKSDKIDAYGS